MTIQTTKNLSLKYFDKIVEYQMMQTTEQAFKPLLKILDDIDDHTNILKVYL